MGIVERIKGLSRLKKGVLILFTAVIMVIVCFPAGYRDIEMNIYYNSYPQDAAVTQVCWDLGQGYSIDEVSTVAIEPVTKVVVDKKYAGKLENIRIDFVDVQGTVNINKIEIKRHGLVLKTYSAQELRNELVPLNDINELDNIMDRYMIECVSNDANVQLVPEFVETINSLFSTQPLERMVLAVIGIVFMAFLVCFVLGLFNRNELVIGIGGIIAVCFVMLYSGVSGGVQMEIYYKEYPSTANATQLVLDVGKGFTVDTVITKRISNITKLYIKEDYADKIQKLRIDFTDVSGKIQIEKIEITKNGFNVKTLTPTDLTNIIYSMNAMEFGEDSAEVLILEAISNDGYVGFSSDFISEFNTFFHIQPQEKHLVYIAVMVVWILTLCIRIIKKICIKLDELFERTPHQLKVGAVVGIFIIGVLYCYRNYIMGRAVFVFGNIAGDSFQQSFPSLHHYADLIAQHREIFGWDFSDGLGTRTKTKILSIFNWVIWFGTNAMPYLMGISQIIKIFLAYIIMYLYLRVLGRRKLTSHIGGMSYALCGYMMIRQYWISYPNIVVLCALVLLCAELCIAKKNYKWLPISLFLYCTSVDAYDIFLIFAMLVGYTIFRYFQLNNSNKIKDILNLLYEVVGAYVVALLASAISIIPSIVFRLSSNRFKEGTSTLRQHILSQINKDILKTAFFNTISNDWCGYDSHYVGWMNILGAPSFYCGLLLLIFIPLAIAKLKKGKKISAIVAVAFSLAYIVVPGINYCINGFSEVGFRLSSIWVFLVIIYLGTLGMDLWLQSTTKRQAITIVTLVLLVVSTTILSVGTKYFNKDVYIRTIGILLFLLIIILVANKIGKNILYVLIVSLAFFDLFSNAHTFCDTPIKVTKKELAMYADDVIKYIQEKDKDDFYRIEKKYRISWCDSLYQNYYGTDQYSGLTNDGLHDFLSKMCVAVPAESYGHHIQGMENYNCLYSLLGVRYVITSNNIDNNYGLDETDQIGNKKIYVNNKELPIGFCYDSVIYDTNFESMGIGEKRKAILDSGVICEEDDIFNLTIKSEQDYIEHLKGEIIAYNYDENERAIFFDEVDSEKVLVIDFVTEGSGEEYCEIGYGNSEGIIGNTHIGSVKGERVQHLEFCGNDLSFLRIKSSTIKAVKNIDIKVYDKTEYYAKLDDYIEDRRAQSFNCDKFTNNRIEGTVNNDKDSILFFSIPYDIGWNIYVDGVKSELMKVNYGFIGTYLPAGDHTVVLQYKMPYMNISMVISVIGVAAIIAWFIYWHKREKGDNAHGENISRSTSVQ